MIRMRKRFILFLTIILLVTSILMTTFLVSKKENSQNVLGWKEVIIYLDPGHGGFDGGAIGIDGTYEKDIVLNICLKLERYFKQSGFKVALTRRTDVALHSPGSKNAKRDDIYKRVSLINKSNADLFLTIHANAFSSSKVKGAQVFYSDKNPSSKDLAGAIQNMISLYHENNHRPSKSISGKYLLDHVEIPGCLVELGFLSNPEDLENLKNDEYLEEMAFIIYLGVLQYLHKNYR